MRAGTLAINAERWHRIVADPNVLPISEICCRRRVWDDVSVRNAAGS
jgi:hypothetical protein